MDDLQAFIQQLLTQRPNEWDRLPDFPLYMDQVLSYMERQTIHISEEDALTASMVNNYAKTGLLPRPEGKKYNQEHMAYLTAICVLKHVMSAKDIDLLIRKELHDRKTTPKDGYAAFCSSLDHALSATAQEVEGYDKSDSLADTAIHFALMSYAFGLVSRQYVTLLRQEQGEKLTAPKKKKGT